MTYYDDIAQGYEELHWDEQMNKLKIIAKHLAVKESDTLLDVGCGSGIATRFWNCHRTGIDTSVKLVDIAKGKDAIGTYLLGRAEQLPFPNHSFDIVISLTAIHNFDDYKKGLSEIERVGKGVFVISVLKRSPVAFSISKEIEANFPMHQVVEEEQDIIFLVGMQDHGQ
ncbi:MAG: class I SAM-dependent methyltransferase [Nanoarchaeota archaeon]